MRTHLTSRTAALAFATLLPFALQPATAEAAAISLVPSSGTVAVGGLVDLALIVTGLESDFDPDEIVAAYDLDIFYSSAFVNATGVAFGTDLGGPLDSLQDFTLPPGVVDLAELSFLFDDELDLLQGDSVLLATLTFQGTAPGTATFGFLAGADDVKGLFNIPLDLAAAGATVDVLGDAPVVPEPATMLLLGTGLAGLAARKRRR